MSKLSAGILMYRRKNNLEVFLVHPGGPFWAKKDEGAWSLPKGEYESEEDALQAAKREFKEETGFEIDGKFIELGQIKQPSGKVITAWAVQDDCDASAIKSNTFEMEWPPHSRKMAKFPEVDRACWFSIDEARVKILKGQVGFLDELREKIKL